MCFLQLPVAMFEEFSNEVTISGIGNNAKCLQLFCCSVDKTLLIVFNEIQKIVGLPNCHSKRIRDSVSNRPELEAAENKEQLEEIDALLYEKVAHRSAIYDSATTTKVIKGTTVKTLDEITDIFSIEPILILEVLEKPTMTKR